MKAVEENIWGTGKVIKRDQEKTRCHNKYQEGFSTRLVNLLVHKAVGQVQDNINLLRNHKAKDVCHPKTFLQKTYLQIERNEAIEICRIINHGKVRNLINYLENSRISEDYRIFKVKGNTTNKRNALNSL